MKYYKKAKTTISRIYILIFVLIIVATIFFTRDIIYRSLVTVNLGSVYVELLNEKAEVINYLKNNEIKTVNLSMSPNNYVRMQKERSSMVSNYVLKGNQWFGDNNYYKVRYNDGSSDVKAEIKLFGMNPDHFRDSDGHSFRLRFDAEQGFGDKKLNFLNPRSRDFITDPLLNIIYGKVYGGLKINYSPARVVLNKSNYGIFYMEDFFDKYFIEQNKKRESLIFEISNDSLYFNHIGEDDSFLEIGSKLNLLYHNDYDSFIDKIDIDKIKALIVLASVINDAHPLSDINMHWYYNNVTGLIEPTIREGFVKKSTSINIDKIVENNTIINDVYHKHIINSDFLYEMKSDLALIKEIILNDEEYNNLKNTMIGFGNKINEKEKVIIENIDLISELLQKEQKVKDNIVKTIYINKDTIISGDYIVPPNTILKIKAGTRIKLKNAYVKVFGEFNAIGNRNKPIIIEGVGRESGTLFFNTKKNILIQDVIFKNLTNARSHHNQPAAITFYECNSINISNSLFGNNLMGDDFINFFRSENISINNVNFENVLYDAIDSDFSELSIKNSVFENIGNDAVDSSGSIINIDNNYFFRVKDKAISAGEESFININNSLFKSNEIALVSKDASRLISKNNLLENNIIDFASFKKKRFFGFPEAVFENTNIKSYLIEENSIIKGLDTIIYSSNIESKLYGNLYGRASE
jgi:hypothetical protein